MLVSQRTPRNAVNPVSESQEWSFHKPKQRGWTAAERRRRRLEKGETKNRRQDFRLYIPSSRVGPGQIAAAKMVTASVGALIAASGLYEGYVGHIESELGAGLQA